MSHRFQRAHPLISVFQLVYWGAMLYYITNIVFIFLWQHVLEKGKEEERNQIIEKLAGQVVSMSQNKYASNVIEKCFQCAGPTHRDLLIRQIIQQTDGNDSLLVCVPLLSLLGSLLFIQSQFIYISFSCQLSYDDLFCFVLFHENLQGMMKDQYANYVVQKILDTCDEQQREVLIGRIRASLPSLRKYTYGKHIVVRVEQLMSEGLLFFLSFILLTLPLV